MENLCRRLRDPQFAYLQVGCILVTLVRNLEFQLDEVPETDYSVSFSSIVRRSLTYHPPTELVRVPERTLHG